MPLAWMAIDLNRVLTGANSIERSEQMMTASTATGLSSGSQLGIGLLCRLPESANNCRRFKHRQYTGTVRAIR
jgi:hypothetical protein